MRQGLRFARPLRTCPEEASKAPIKQMIEKGGTLYYVLKELYRMAVQDLVGRNVVVQLISGADQPAKEFPILIEYHPHSGWLGFSTEALRRRKKQKHHRVSKVAFATACLACGLNKES